MRLDPIYSWPLTPTPSSLSSEGKSEYISGTATWYSKWSKATRITTLMKCFALREVKWLTYARGHDRTARKDISRQIKQEIYIGEGVPSSLNSCNSINPSQAYRFNFPRFSSLICYSLAIRNLTVDDGKKINEEGKSREPETILSRLSPNKDRLLRHRTLHQVNPYRYR